MRQRSKKQTECGHGIIVGVHCKCVFFFCEYLRLHNEVYAFRTWLCSNQADQQF